MKSPISNRRNLRDLCVAVVALGLLAIAARTLINLQTQVQGILPVANGGTGNTAGRANVTVYTVATLPGSPSAGDIAPVSDGASGSDCTTGGGSTAVLCQYNGAAWSAVSSGGSAGVSSLNALTGALSLTSSDSSVNITPSGSTIDLSAIGGGGSSDPTFASVPSFQTKTVEGQRVSVAAGVEQTMLSLPAGTSGTVLSIWVAANSSTLTQNTPINVYYDGAISPQLSLDFTTLGTNWMTLGNVYAAQRSQIGIGTAGAAYPMACLRWPIYFGDGIKITWNNTTAGTDTLYFDILYTTDRTSDLRLYAKNVQWGTPVSGFNLATTTYDFLSQASNSGLSTVTIGSGGSGYSVGDVINVVQTGAFAGSLTVTSVSGGAVTGVSVKKPGSGYSVASGLSTYSGTGTGCTVNITAVGTNSPGAIVAQYLTGVGTSNFTWLEADINAYLDGEASPSYVTSGTEDFFTSQGYFLNGKTMQTPWMFQSSSHTSTATAYIDLLDWMGGIKYSNGIILRWDGVTHDSGIITTTVTFAYATLFYE